jgi:O-antigen/teichoic acid export membrane protein
MLNQGENNKHLEHYRELIRVLLKVVSLLSPLILIPIVLNLTDANIYGNYFTILSLFYFFIAMDLGIANIANGNYAHFQKNADNSKLLYINQSVRVLNRIFTILIIPSLSSCFFIINHLNDYRWQDFEVMSLRISAVFTFAVYLAFMGNLGLKLDIAQSKTIKVALMTAAQVLCPFILLVTGIDEVNLLHLVFFFILIPQIPTAVNLFFSWRTMFIREYNQLTSFKFYRLTELVRQGSLFMFLQITTVISTQIDSLLVGVVLGGVAAAELSITWRYYAVPLQFLSLFAMPLWGMASVSKVNGRSPMIWGKLRRLVLQSVIFTSIFGLVSFFVSQLIIESWTGSSISPPLPLIICCSIWLLLSSIIVHVASVLNGWGERRILFLVYLVSSLVNLVLSFVFTIVLDSNIGALLGSILAQSFFFLLPSVIYLRKAMSIERYD